MLFQCGVHSLHRLAGLFGPVAAVQSMMRYDVHTATRTADVSNVLLRHESGLLGTLNCYHVTAYVHEFRLFGTDGNLYVDTHANRAFFQKRLVNRVEPRVELPMPKMDSHMDCINVANWYRAIRQEGPASPSLQDGINAELPVFAAVLATERKCEVSIQEVLA